MMRSYLLLCLAAAVCATGAEWEPLGPFGGSAAIVLVDRHHDTVLAATSNAQIFRSEDNGDSWKAMPFPARFRATLHAFAVDHQNADVYFVGLSSENPAYSGIMRTSDGGLTWSRIAEPELRDVWSLSIWQQDSRIMAAGTESGVFLTHDAGATWALVTPDGAGELKPVVSLKFDPWDSKILYAGTPHLPWKSVDGGSTWQSIHQGMLEDSDVFAIVVDDRRRSRIFAATCGGIYRSLDGGAVWVKRAEAKGASYRTYHIAQDPVQPNVLLAGTTLGLVKSDDSGATWRRISEHSTRWITFDPARPNRVFVATDDLGIFRSDDGGETLQAINRGFTNRRLASVATVNDSLYVTALSSQGSSVLRRLESGSEWEEAPEIDPESIQPAAYRSSAKDPWIHDVVSISRRELLAATSRGLAMSRNAGLTWQLVPGALGGTTISALGQHPTRSAILFASRLDGIFRSSDQGRTWTLLTADEHPDDVVSLMVLPGDTDRLYALSRSRGVFVMTLPPE